MLLLRNWIGKRTHHRDAEDTEEFQAWESTQVKRILITAVVSRGEYAGEILVPWKDQNGYYAALDPADRFNAKEYAMDNKKTRALSVLKSLVEKGCSVRMTVPNTGCSPRLISAKHIHIGTVETIEQ